MLENVRRTSFFAFFFFNDTATTEIYTLSLHDALPIFTAQKADGLLVITDPITFGNRGQIIEFAADRKSTRLNSSHSQISYAVFCLKKKNNEHRTQHPSMAS